jgi:hypothetical protein
MPKVNFRVRVNGSLVPELQTLTLNTGRRQVTDPFKAGTATLTGRNLATLPTINIGQTADIEFDQGTGSYVLWWSGYVSDLSKSFGFTTTGDQWTLQLEDSLAVAGRASTRAGFSWLAGDTTGDAAASAGNDAGVRSGAIFVPGTFKSTVSAQSIPNTNFLDILNQLATTEQGRLFPVRNGFGGPGPGVNFRPRNDFYNTLSTVFTDDTVASGLTKITYNQVNFVSQADSYFDVVIVTPEGLAPQQSGTGTRLLNIATYDQTTTQAKSLADYLSNTLSVRDATPYSLSVFNDVQTNNAALNLAKDAAGTRVQVILRGQTYNVTVEGGTISANSEQTRVTLYFAPAVVTVPFILDDAVQGVLDQNRLGF